MNTDEVRIFYDDDNPLAAALKEIDNALVLSKEGLLKNEELEQIEARSIKRIEENLQKNSLIYRKYDRFKSKTRWKDAYPKTYVDFRYANDILKEIRQIIAEALGEKTFSESPVPQNTTEKIVKKLKNNEFRVQSNREGNNEHLFIFDRNDHSGSHVHLVVDGQTGEVRVDPKDKSPHDLLEKVTTITTRSGVKIRSTKTTLEFLEEDPDKSITKPLTTFEINENKPLTWAHQGTGFNVVWGLGLTLKINNFNNERPDYISVKLIGNTNDGSWESKHFIFQEIKEKMDKPDEPFEVAPHKITEIGVVLSQELPEHSSSNRHMVPKPDFDTNTVVLVILTESGSRQEIKIKSRLISNA